MPMIRNGRVHANEKRFDHANWGSRVPDDQWAVYSRVIGALQDERIPFALGGAFALAAYSGYWRNTKDLDLYILERDRQHVVDELHALGLADYHDTLAYDRGWIYRAHTGEIIVDAIFGMPNRRTSCDTSWLLTGPEVHVRDKLVRVVPADRLVWAKIYVMQRPRCDWPDILNIIYGAGHRMNWDRLIASLGEDLPLLRGIMSTFAWLAPGRARKLDGRLWQRLGLPQPDDGPEFIPERVRLLESRPWFAPLVADEHAGRDIRGHQTNSAEESLQC